MGLGSTISRIGERHLAIVVIVGGGLAALRVWHHAAGPALALLAIAILMLDRCVSRRRWGEPIAERLEELTGVVGTGSIATRLAGCMALISERLKEGERRLDQRHLVTGLPTREPLIRRMAVDGAGLLGVVGIIDFDRLCAFDPASGERVLMAIVDRLTRMLPADRLIAHVDRASIALWFGSDVEEAAAHRQLEVLAYALGEGVADGERNILPEIRVRHAALTGGLLPHALLSRTLASLSLHPGEIASAVMPATDPALVARERYTFEQDLRQAMGRNELEMRYQPLIDAGLGRVVGAEALVRWSHPTRGSVSPGQFIPVMEAMGLAHEIGLWVLNAAVREAKAWQAIGSLRVAVNVSGRQLDRADVASLVARTLARHALPPEALEIELTESVAMSDGVRAAAVLDELRATGIKIAIDDFGTGYSSLSALRTLTFDKIKIDREFVSHVDKRRDSQAICQSIIALARGLGIRVLAEGVERRPEYQWLLRHGCTHFQGYYFSPPLTGTDFAAFVRDADGLARLIAPHPGPVQERIAERSLA
jgi:Amt family ammonium transporter